MSVDGVFGDDSIMIRVVRATSEDGRRCHLAAWTTGSWQITSLAPKSRFWP